MLIGSSASSHYLLASIPFILCVISRAQLCVCVCHDACVAVYAQQAIGNNVQLLLPLFKMFLPCDETWSPCSTPKLAAFVVAAGVLCLHTLQGRALMQELTVMQELQPLLCWHILCRVLRTMSLITFSCCDTSGIAGWQVQWAGHRHAEEHPAEGDGEGHGQEGSPKPWVCCC
jgi:hypothetical protein